MPPQTVYLETFGCQMNELDSELVMSQLRALGYEFSSKPDNANVVLYNTCSVRDLAEQKVRSRLGELKVRKMQDPSLVVGVLGCMAERDGEDLLRRMPVVDILCGPGELDKLPGLLDNAVKTASVRSGSVLREPSQMRSAREVALQGNASRRSSTLAAAEDSLELLDLSRSISATSHRGSAYVRITRGCNKFCTYCVVPQTRGAEMHRPPEHIIDECKKLADAGVIEITLLGQTVNHYRYEHGAAVTVDGRLQSQKGRTYKGGHQRDPYSGSNTTTFAKLLHRIHEEVPQILRLRFVTSYPRDFGDDVLEVMRDSPRICRYLHVPAQSGSDRVLERMNRGYRVGEYLEFIDRARAHLDQPAIGRPLMVAGDIICGFSGETQDDHQASAKLLALVGYKNCFVFKYSPRPGTVAHDRLPDDVPDQVKRRRVNELLAIQHEISDKFAQAQVGHTLDVFVQGVSAHEQKKRSGRIAGSRASGNGGAVPITIGGSAFAEADPDESGIDIAGEASHVEPTQLTGRTDGDLIVVFDCPAGHTPDSLVGTIVPARITAAQTLTLWGEVVIGEPQSV